MVTHTPPKNLVIKIVCKFSAVAVAALKQMNMNNGTTMAILLPYTSEIGPNRTGPRAKPYGNPDQIVVQHMKQKVN